MSILKFPKHPPKIKLGDSIVYWVDKPCYEQRTGIIELLHSPSEYDDNIETDNILVACTSCNHHRIDEVPRWYIISVE